MQTIYDWLSVILFCGLALTFLERSLRPIKGDSMLRYIPPAAGCALGNWLGNSGYTVAAAAVLASVLVYYLTVLRPLRDFRK